MTAQGAHDCVPAPPVKQQQQEGKRQLCTNCRRPQRVCLCAALPVHPVPLQGHVIVLQHPHEGKKAFATVPLLKRCVRDCTIIVGRQLMEAKHSHTDEFLSLVRDSQAAVPLYVLFPASGAADLEEVASCSSHTDRLAAAQPRLAPAPENHTGAPVCAGQPQEQEKASDAAGSQPAAAAQIPGTGDAQEPTPQPAVPHASPSPAPAASGPVAFHQASCPPAYILLAIDGTWKEAKEMYNKLQPLLLPPNGSGKVVRLQAIAPKAAEPSAAEQQQGEQAGAQTQERSADGTEASQPVLDANACLIRKEPVEGFITTHEAVGRAVTLLERRPDLTDVLLAPLRLMTSYQAQWDPAVRDRIAGKREEESEAYRPKMPKKQRKAGGGGGGAGEAEAEAGAAP